MKRNENGRRLSLETLTTGIVAGKVPHARGFRGGRMRDNLYVGEAKMAPTEREVCHGIKVR